MYFHPAYKAFMGYVPGSPGSVYFDYKHETRSFSGITFGELAVGIETGMLPDPDHVVRQ